VGDLLTCSAEGALSYRWTNGAHGQTVSISQPGTFNYECSVFVACGDGVFCPFSKKISGFAEGCLFSWYRTTGLDKNSQMCLKNHLGGSTRIQAVIHGIVAIFEH